MSKQITQKAIGKNNSSVHSNANQPNQDFGNQSSILHDANYKNQIDITNTSMNFLEEVDQKWMELKVEGKNIPRRSYHSAVVYQGKMYIYGGYDVNSGILSDFWEMELCQENYMYQWRQVVCSQVDKSMDNQEQLENIHLPGQRERHQAVVFEDKMYLFGGLKNTLENTNQMHTFCFKNNIWELVKYEGNLTPPTIDSHSIAVAQDKKEIWVFGGFINDKENGGYSNDIYIFNTETSTWSQPQVDKENAPKPRAGSSICYLQNTLYMFGGTNVTRKFNDLWTFSEGVWTEVQQKNKPESRNGHSLLVFEDQIILFGGIHDVTHEKNDLITIGFGETEWKVVDSDTSHKKEDGEFSPRDNRYEENANMKNASQTQKKINNTTQYIQADVYNKKKHQASSRLYQTMRQQKEETTIQNEMDFQKSYLTQNFQNEDNSTQNQMEENKKRRMEMKKVALLNEFKLTEDEKKMYNSNSPTTVAMKNSILSVGNPEGKRKYDVKASIKTVAFQKNFEFRKNKIIGKAPSARDGQSAVIYENYCIIFGGDRHLMAYNDLFQVDLEVVTGKKLPEEKKQKQAIKVEHQQQQQEEQQIDEKSQKQQEQQKEKEAAKQQEKPMESNTDQQKLQQDNQQQLQMPSQ